MHPAVSWCPCLYPLCRCLASCLFSCMRCTCSGQCGNVLAPNIKGTCLPAPLNQPALPNTCFYDAPCLMNFTCHTHQALVPTPPTPPLPVNSLFLCVESAVVHAIFQQRNFPRAAAPTEAAPLPVCRPVDCVQRQQASRIGSEQGCSAAPWFHRGHFLRSAVPGKASNSFSC